jgi:hypothetical protein
MTPSNFFKMWKTITKARNRKTIINQTFYKVLQNTNPEKITPKIFINIK